MEQISPSLSTHISHASHAVQDEIQDLSTSAISMMDISMLDPMDSEKDMTEAFCADTSQMIELDDSTIQNNHTDFSNMVEEDLDVTSKLDEENQLKDHTEMLLDGAEDGAILDADKRTPKYLKLTSFSAADKVFPENIQKENIQKEISSNHESIEYSQLQINGNNGTYRYSDTFTDDKGFLDNNSNTSPTGNSVQAKKLTTFDSRLEQQTNELQQYLLNKTYQLYATQKNDEQNAKQHNEQSHELYNDDETRQSFQELQAHRRNVLKFLEKELVNFFTGNIESLKQCTGDECCRLLVFGSCRLGVESWNSDIDIVAVVPQIVTKDVFFVQLRKFLEMNSNVTCFNAVTDAYVPLMKFTFHGVPIDLLYAPINVDKFGKDFNILDESHFFNVDEATQRALNGPRVADEILILVPDEHIFRLTLRCVKLWARRRGIYSNSFGYLGGIAWTLLVANICRLFPNDSPTRLLRRFFHVYRHWKWPSPVILKDIDFEEKGCRVWNPNRYINDRAQLMPIITPSYPSMNSSFNVNRTSLRLITEEFIRGDSILNRVPTVDQIPNTVFDELFEENNFFIRYKMYLQLEVSAETPDEHRVWEAFIESRLRFLVLALEHMDSLLVHPYPHSFSAPAYYTGKTTSLFYIGLKYMKHASLNGDGEKQKHRVDLTRAASTFELKLREWDKVSSGMHIPTLTLVKRSQIPEFVCSLEKKRYFVRERKRKLDELSGKVPQSPSPFKRAKQTLTVAENDQSTLDAPVGTPPLIPLEAARQMTDTPSG